MYFDAVLTDNLFVKFNGTPTEVKAWIEANNPEKLEIHHQVCIGQTLQYVSIREYLASWKSEATS